MSDPALNQRCCAIIVAAGASRRMGFDKLASSLAGLPVLRRTIEAFLTAESIHSVVVVCPEARWSLLDGMVFSKPITRVDGGSERQDSVMKGLEAIEEDCRLVAVHDGARPLISPEDIDACVACAVAHRAVALARRASDTMKRSDEAGYCVESVDRTHLWCMETPQAFDADLLREAYRSVVARGLVVTDEVSCVQANGVAVKFIESKHSNLKITTPADIALAEALWNLRE